ncbi:MAG: nucleotidyltransferase family protein [Clostridia bacterium]|nr:nucleotidyltransferase family protein [Clostridia bacterium]
MDNNLTKLLFALLKSAVHGAVLSQEEKALFSAELLPELYSVSKKQDLSHLISEALNKNNLIIEGNEYCQKLEEEQFNAVFRYEQLSFELKRLTAVLEEAEIPFIRLKGSVMRGYYPDPKMRLSSDIDVLIKKEDLARAERHLASKLNYIRKRKTDHDLGLTSKSGVLIELHYDLIEAGKAKECRRVLSRFFNASNVKEGCVYQRESLNEMFYFYHIAHMAKHFDSGGCGIRPFIDLWILTHRLAYNKEKTAALLKEGGLLEFALHCENLSRVWFSGEEHNETTRKMQSFILSGGVFGSNFNRVNIRSAKQNGKFAFILSRIFPSFIMLKNMYPVLEKCPLLTPFCHIARWCRIIFKGQTKRAVREFKISNRLTDEENRSMKEFMKEIGLL